MEKLKMTKKALALSLAMSMAIGALAQNGLFQRGDSDIGSKPHSVLMRDGATALSLSNQQFGSLLGGENVTNQGFGVLYVSPGITNQSFNTPLGSGMLVLLAASAGYATVKSRKRNRTQNKK